ncbi:MAG TPA: SDR family NAD(P)-dependent oxidoreductase [Candidatus Melainabacteria bacterium]|nr:SDR family NAD(P)-dependent oxidoreductase [Candidatus Melainabacteria bacterium]
MVQNDKSTRRKLAFITGASRGIGRAIAERLMQDGFDLALFARSKDLLAQLEKDLRAQNISAHAFAVDVSHAAEFHAALEAAREKMGAPQVLINNAGVYFTQAVEKHSIDLFREVLETNLTSALNACQFVVSDMKESGWGRIINMSSISGKVAEAYGSAYSASKFGLIGLTQSLALEVAEFGITVNAVCPGWVATEMARAQLNDETWCRLNQLEISQSEEIARLSVPQKRLIQPEEVAHLVSFLCSENARGITGQSINICGGLSLN